MSTRKEVKAGKHERIRKLLSNMRVLRPEPVVKDFPSTLFDDVASNEHNKAAYKADTHGVRRGDDLSWPV